MSRGGCIDGDSPDRYAACRSGSCRGSEPHVRRWKRCRVLLVRAKGLSVVAVATALDRNQASVFAGCRCCRPNWRPPATSSRSRPSAGGTPVVLAREATAPMCLDSPIRPTPKNGGRDRATASTPPSSIGYLPRGELSRWHWPPPPSCGRCAPSSQGQHSPAPKRTRSPGGRRQVPDHYSMQRRGPNIQPFPPTHIRAARGSPAN